MDVRFLINSKKPGQTIEEVFPLGRKWDCIIPDVDDRIEWIDAAGKDHSYLVIKRLFQFKDGKGTITIQLG